MTQVSVDKYPTIGRMICSTKSEDLVQLFAEFMQLTQELASGAVTNELPAVKHQARLERLELVKQLISVVDSTMLILGSMPRSSSVDRAIGELGKATTILAREIKA